MDGRPTWTDCDEAGDYVVPNVLSPRDLGTRPDIMDETVPHATFPWSRALTHPSRCNRTRHRVVVSHLGRHLGLKTWRPSWPQFCDVIRAKAAPIQLLFMRNTFFVFFSFI